MPYSIPGKRHSHQAEHAAEGHDHGKRDGQNPHGWSAELSAPQADRNHGEHVIESRDGMAEASEEADSLAFLRVREGRLGPKQNDREHAAPLEREAVSVSWSSGGSEHDGQALHRPEGSERADGVAGKRFGPARPANFEDAEGALQQENECDEGELSDFDSDIEGQQRNRQFSLRADLRW